MDRSDLIRLRHMLDSARDAQIFVRGRTRQELEGDRQLVLALVKAIEIIGEAASQVSAQARAEVSSLPWRNIIDMRHRLVHAYYDVDLDILWNTIEQDLPPLIDVLESIREVGR